MEHFFKVAHCKILANSFGSRRTRKENQNGKNLFAIRVFLVGCKCKFRDTFCRCFCVILVFSSSVHARIYGGGGGGRDHGARPSQNFQNFLNFYLLANVIISITIWNALN